MHSCIHLFSTAGNLYVTLTSVFFSRYVSFSSPRKLIVCVTKKYELVGAEYPKIIEFVFENNISDSTLFPYDLLTTFKRRTNCAAM